MLKTRERTWCRQAYPGLAPHAWAQRNTGMQSSQPTWFVRWPLFELSEEVGRRLTVDDIRSLGHDWGEPVVYSWRRSYEGWAYPCQRCSWRWFSWRSPCGDEYGGYLTSDGRLLQWGSAQAPLCDVTSWPKSLVRTMLRPTSRGPFPGMSPTAQPRTAGFGPYATETLWAEHTIDADIPPTGYPATGRAASMRAFSRSWDGEVTLSQAAARSAYVRRHADATDAREQRILRQLAADAAWALTKRRTRAAEAQVAALFSSPLT